MDRGSVHGACFKHPFQTLGCQVLLALSGAFFFAWSGELCCGVVAISREVSVMGFQFHKQRKEDVNVTVAET